MKTIKNILFKVISIAIYKFVHYIGKKMGLNRLISPINSLEETVIVQLTTVPESEL